MTEQTATPQQQVENLKQQLLEAYVQRDRAKAEQDAADEKIRAIRNVIAGIPIGQALATQATSGDSGV